MIIYFIYRGKKVVLDSYFSQIKRQLRLKQRPLCMAFSIVSRKNCCLVHERLNKIEQSREVLREGRSASPLKVRFSNVKENKRYLYV